MEFEFFLSTVLPLTIWVVILIVENTSLKKPVYSFFRRVEENLDDRTYRHHLKKNSGLIVIDREAWDKLLKK